MGDPGDVIDSSIDDIRKEHLMPYNRYHLLFHIFVKDSLLYSFRKLMKFVVILYIYFLLFFAFHWLDFIIFLSYYVLLEALFHFLRTSTSPFRSRLTLLSNLPCYFSFWVFVSWKYFFVVIISSNPYWDFWQFFNAWGGHVHIY